MRSYQDVALNQARMYQIDEEGTTVPYNLYRDNYIMESVSAAAMDKTKKREEKRDIAAEIKLKHANDMAGCHLIGRMQGTLGKLKRQRIRSIHLQENGQQGQLHQLLIRKLIK